jgi:hypothetical protein
MQNVCDLELISSQRKSLAKIHLQLPLIRQAG